MKFLTLTALVAVASSKTQLINLTGGASTETVTTGSGTPTTTTTGTPSTTTGTPSTTTETPVVVAADGSSIEAEAGIVAGSNATPNEACPGEKMSTEYAKCVYQNGKDWATTKGAESLAEFKAYEAKMDALSGGNGGLIIGLVLGVAAIGGGVAVYCFCCKDKDENSEGGVLSKNQQLVANLLE